MKKKSPYLISIFFVITLVPFLITAGGTDEFIGEGNSSIVGGNTASARGRAIDLAQKNALENAAHSIVNTISMSNAYARLTRDIFAQFKSYVKHYRVLKEEHDNKLFNVQLSVVVHLKQLRDDLQRILGRRLPSSGALTRHQLPGQSIEAGKQLVSVSGVLNFLQHETICGVLETRIIGVKSCRLWQLQAGQIWYAVNTDMAAEVLADSIVKQNFDGFVLKQKDIRGGIIWLELVLTPDLIPGADAQP